MKTQKTPEREQTIKALMAFLERQTHGAAIGYVDVETATGIQMRTEKERGALFTALARMKIDYLTKKEWGVILSSANNARDIAGARFGRVRRAVDKYGKTATRLFSKHEADLTQYDKNILIQDIGLAGALKASAKAHHVTRQAELTAGKPPAPMLPTKI